MKRARHSRRSPPSGDPPTRPSCTRDFRTRWRLQHQYPSKWSEVLGLQAIYLHPSGKSGNQGSSSRLSATLSARIAEDSRTRSSRSSQGRRLHQNARRLQHGARRRFEARRLSLTMTGDPPRRDARPGRTVSRDLHPSSLWHGQFYYRAQAGGRGTGLRPRHPRGSESANRGPAVPHRLKEYVTFAFLRRIDKQEARHLTLMSWTACSNGTTRFPVKLGAGSILRSDSWTEFPRGILLRVRARPGPRNDLHGSGRELASLSAPIADDSPAQASVRQPPRVPRALSVRDLATPRAGGSSGSRASCSILLPGVFERRSAAIQDHRIDFTMQLGDMVSRG